MSTKVQGQDCDQDEKEKEEDYDQDYDQNQEQIKDEEDFQSIGNFLPLYQESLLTG